MAAEISDVALESYYLQRWRETYGWDYFEPPEEDPEEMEDE